MNNDNPASGRGARVLSFRRGGRPARPPRGASPPRDLSKYESDDTPDDYRHRMMVNLAAFAFLVCLMGAGYWLADTLARQRKNQDCVLSGRRACSPEIVQIQQMHRGTARE